MLMPHSSVFARRLDTDYVKLYDSIAEGRAPYNKMPENVQVSAALTEISFLSQSPLLATYDNIF